MAGGGSGRLAIIFIRFSPFEGSTTFSKTMGTISGFVIYVIEKIQKWWRNYRIRRRIKKNQEMIQMRRKIHERNQKNIEIERQRRKKRIEEARRKQVTKWLQDNTKNDKVQQQQQVQTVNARRRSGEVTLLFRKLAITNNYNNKVKKNTNGASSTP